MKYLIVSGFLLSTLLGSNILLAQTGCATLGYTTQLNEQGIKDALNDKRIIASGDEEWKEDHCDGGALHKIGDGTVVDPYAYRGTWTASDAGVTYNYTVGGSSNYTFQLYINDSGGLCWSSGNNVVATSNAPDSAGSCSAP